MKFTRRDFSKLAGAGLLAAAAPRIFSPALAQDKPLKIGIIAPRSGVAGTAGECGIRAVQWAAERMNKDGGIAGRKIELVIEEETNPKDTIERFRRLILQEKVESVHGLISTGVSLGVAPVAEEEQALMIMWDGTTQDGVKEMMPNSK
ncbi:MAG: ABC transporter substrate-binding protein, partial [Pseudomonadota bacterium]